MKHGEPNWAALVREAMLSSDVLIREDCQTKEMFEIPTTHEDSIDVQSGRCDLHCGPAQGSLGTNREPENGPSKLFTGVSVAPECYWPIHARSGSERPFAVT